MTSQPTQPKNILRTVVINLARHNDRWEWVKANFNAAGLNIERLEAFDAKDPAAQPQIDAVVMPGAGLSRAEAACILSHRKAWQWLIESNDDYIAVFEDDVHVAADMSSVLNTSNLQTGMDLVKLEIPTGKASYRHKASYPLADRALHRLLSKACGSAGYIVSRRCAKRLLELSEACDEPVDIILFDDKSPIWQEFGVFQTVPAACIQDFLLAKRKNERGTFASAIEDDRSNAKTARHIKTRKGRRSIPLGKLGKYLRAIIRGAHPLHHKGIVPLELNARKKNPFIDG